MILLGCLLAFGLAVAPRCLPCPRVDLQRPLAASSGAATGWCRCWASSSCPSRRSCTCSSGPRPASRAGTGCGSSWASSLTSRSTRSRPPTASTSRATPARRPLGLGGTTVEPVRPALIPRLQRAHRVHRGRGPQEASEAGAAPGDGMHGHQGVRQARPFRRWRASHTRVAAAGVPPERGRGGGVQGRHHPELQAGAPDFVQGR